MWGKGAGFNLTPSLLLASWAVMSRRWKLYSAIELWRCLKLILSSFAASTSFVGSSSSREPVYCYGKFKLKYSPGSGKLDGPLANYSLNGFMSDVVNCDGVTPSSSSMLFIMGWLSPPDSTMLSIMLMLCLAEIVMWSFPMILVWVALVWSPRIVSLRSSLGL